MAMTLGRIDGGELLTALYAVGTDAPFALFLERFRRRVGGALAALVEHRGRGGWTIRFAADRDVAAALPLDRTALTVMRPGRVYDLAEVDSMAGAGRLVRSGSAAGDQWLAAFGGGRGFSAADSVLMADLSPHVAIACDTLARLDDAREEAAAAGAALARGGIGWALLDIGGGRVAGAAPPASPRDRATLADAVAGGAPLAVGGEAVAVPPPADTGAAALALFRTPTQPINRARAFAAAHGLSLPEARLATALADGASIAGAARMLGITEATARFYSKRLYAATGTTGQADLVRLVWTGVAALA